MTRTAVATDAFPYSDGSLATVGSANWDNTNSAGSFNVASNKVQMAFPNPVARHKGTYSDDQYVKMTYSGVGNTFDTMGVVVRHGTDVDANRDFYALYTYFGGAGPWTTTLVKVVNGSPTTLATQASVSWADSDTIELEVVTSGADAVLTGYRNGTALGSITDITDSSSPLASGKPGIYGGSISSNTIRGDDWEGGDLTGGGSSAGAAFHYYRQAQ